MDTDEQRDNRPMPGPGDGDTKTEDAPSETGSAPQPKDDSDATQDQGERGSADGAGDGDEDKPEIPEPSEDGEGRIALDRSDESQDFVDQSKIDFDPDEGLYSGTAVDGTSEIPGPHADDGDEGSVMEQAKEMAGDDPPESEGQIGTMMRSMSKKDDESDDDAEAKDERTPDSSDEQAYS
jgi:hypothetical protein